MSPSSRCIEIIVHPVDRFARSADGPPLGADTAPGVIRILETAAHGDIVAPASTADVYWLITPRSAQGSLDFQLYRNSLWARGRVALGVVSGARRGAGAILVVPTLAGFVLQAIDRRSSSGPFERIFSTRPMAMLIDHWADQIVDDHASDACVTVRESASARAHTTIWASTDSVRSIGEPPRSADAHT